jgi:hypothetical protein
VVCKSATVLKEPRCVCPARGSESPLPANAALMRRLASR